MSEKPLAYVRGVWPFMGYEFFAEEGTIYPREESGIVVREIVRLAASGALPGALAGTPAGTPAETLRIIDQCGGSGNLGCVMAMSIPRAHVWTTDLNEKASALARRNIEKHGLVGRVDALTGDLFKPFDSLGLAGQIDAIGCSPPFISTGRLTRDRAYLLEHEPREAFDAGPYGLSIHMRVVKECLPLLRTGGYFVCEFGEGQAKQVESLVTRARAYDDIRILTDADGVARAISARKAVAAATSA
jgi:release factor glutamine methyltransferase